MSGFLISFLERRRKKSNVSFASNGFVMRDMGIVGRKRAADLLLLPIFFIIFLGRFQAVSGLNDTKYRQVSSLRLGRIKGHLDKINKPAVLTIEVYTYTILTFFS
jgi:hypothetical protein